MDTVYEELDGEESAEPLVGAPEHSWVADSINKQRQRVVEEFWRHWAPLLIIICKQYKQISLRVPLTFLNYSYSNIIIIIYSL